MLYILSNNSGEVARAERREPRYGYWAIYRRAKREYPELVEEMYETIRQVVASEQYMDSNKRFPNSTWMGSQILRSWRHKDEWNTFCKNDRISGALFGEIMWTVMFDDERDWCTTRSPTTDPEREERVYWLKQK